MTGEEQGPSEQPPAQDAAPTRPPSAQDAVPTEPPAPAPAMHLPDFELELQFRGAEPAPGAATMVPPPEMRTKIVEVERKADD